MHYRANHTTSEHLIKSNGHFKNDKSLNMMYIKKKKSHHCVRYNHNRSERLPTHYSSYKIVSQLSTMLKRQSLPHLGNSDIIKLYQLSSGNYNSISDVIFGIYYNHDTT